MGNAFTIKFEDTKAILGRKYKSIIRYFKRDRRAEYIYQKVYVDDSEIDFP